MSANGAIHIPIEKPEDQWSCKRSPDILASKAQNLESFHKKLVQISKVVPEKIRFDFLYVHDLPQGQEITLTFNTHIPSYMYIQLDDCSY